MCGPRVCIDDDDADEEEAWRMQHSDDDDDELRDRRVNTERCMLIVLMLMLVKWQGVDFKQEGFFQTARRDCDRHNPIHLKPSSNYHHPSCMQRKKRTRSSWTVVEGKQIPALTRLLFPRHP